MKRGNKKVQKYLKLLTSQEISITTPKEKQKIIEETINDISLESEEEFTEIIPEDKKISDKERKLVIVPKSKIYEIRICYKKKRKFIK